VNILLVELKRRAPKPIVSSMAQDQRASEAYGELVGKNSWL
jgi:hypothetical protein